MLRGERVLRVVHPCAAGGLERFRSSRSCQRFLETGQLAGVRTLDLCESLLEEGLGLKDATPYNVLFRGPRPVFIDWLSFERRDPHDPTWQAYAQFCRAFLLPLAVNGHTVRPTVSGAAGRPGSRGGIRLDGTAEALDASLPVARLDPEVAGLVAFVEEALGDFTPAWVLDVGANTGSFSAVAAASRLSGTCGWKFRLTALMRALHPAGAILLCALAVRFRDRLARAACVLLLLLSPLTAIFASSSRRPA